MKLTYLEKLFIAAYNENGGNGTQAYLSIKPHVSRHAAAVSAVRMLKRPAVASTLHRKIEKKIDDAIASKKRILQEMHEVRERAQVRPYFTVTFILYQKGQEILKIQGVGSEGLSQIR